MRDRSRHCPAREADDSHDSHGNIEEAEPSPAGSLWVRLSAESSTSDSADSPLNRGTSSRFFISCVPIDSKITPPVAFLELANSSPEAEGADASIASSKDCTP